MGNKKKATGKCGLGKSLVKDRFAKNVNKRTVGDSMLHTAEINDGYDWGRLNLQSVTEESSFQEFLSTAELAGTDFKSEKLNVSIVTPTSGLLNKSERAKKEAQHKELANLLKIPRRPKWDASTTAEQLQEEERASFLQWRHDLAMLQEEKELILTPYEKNLEFWRQLWRVVEKSDVLVQILDARNPLLFRCEDLESYVRERKIWADYFKEKGVTVAFFSAIMEDIKNEIETIAEEDETSEDEEDEEEDEKEDEDSSKNKPPPEKVETAEESKEEAEQVVSPDLDLSSKILCRQELVEYFKSFEIPGKDVTCIGLVGYPNVGKSSTINSLLQEKKVSVSNTPGKTKHFQTLFLEPKLMLCDCPGLVMPSFVCTKADMVTNGILPVDQLRDHMPPVNLITSLIPRHVLEDKYGIIISRPHEDEDPDRNPTADEFLSAYGYNRGFMTQRGLPDVSRSARCVLKDYVNGKLLYCYAPPNCDQKTFHTFPERIIKPQNPCQPMNQRFKPSKISGETLDKVFFAKATIGAHVKSAVPTVGAASGLASGSSVAGSSTNLAFSGKPGKKHFNKHKKEKLRRVYGLSLLRFTQSSMELSHSLILNEAALAPIPDDKKPIFILEWLRFVDKVLSAAHKSDIKECQGQLLEQLISCMQNSPGPPIRRLIGKCLATLFSVGDTFMLFDTVNKCNDILKVRDDSPSFLPTRLAVICCLGCMYEKLGRMMGRSYEETLQILVKTLKNAESQTRIEIICTFEKICTGMGNAITNVHKEIYKCVKNYMTDRVMAVRCAAAKCLLGMLQHAPFLYTTELENVALLCIRSFDGSNYEVRCWVAKLLGTLVAKTQMTDGKDAAGNKNNGPAQSGGKNVKNLTIEEALGILQSGFIKGSGAGFLKGTGEMIKGTSNVCREIRVGISHSYVMFVRAVGPDWLERNMQPFVNHLLELVANPKVAASHMDAVYSRKCISHVLRSTLGRMLGERAQLAACKELAICIAKHLSTSEALAENAKESAQDSMYNQHMLVCALQEMGCLLVSLGTTASSILVDAQSGLINATFALLVHPCQAARLAAAWCLRCVCVAVPSHTTPLIDRCLERVESMRSSPEAIAGYSCALAAILGGVRLSALGVPHTKGKIIFNTAEELLRSASQNSRLSMNRTQAGWLLIGSIMTLGVPVVKGLLPRMLLLWRNSFPRSNKELESEKARGDAFTWQITLEGRSGALSAIHSLLYHCPELVTDDIVRRLLTPIESALAMLTNISSVLKSYGQQLKAPAAMVRLRLYETLTLLPSHSFESSYTHLLRLLVSEFTLAENPANTATSLLRSMYHADDNILLGSCLQENDHKQIEDQLQGISSAGSGALEHDICCLYRPELSEDNFVPGPIPLGVAVIDQSLILFGQIFLRVAPKHKLQMLTHFSECIKQAKSTRQEVVLLNVFTALLGGLKGMAESKNNGGLGTEEVKKAMVTLIQSGLTSPNPVLRYASGEAIGRLAQAVAEPRFTADLAQYSFDRLTSARDATSRTGHSLALGCLHKYVGGLGSSQHLNTSISILLALAQDLASPVVQLWSLHALALIADSGGPMFRGYVEPTLSLAVKLLLTVPLSHSDVHQCIAKVLSALITTIGPELQGGSNTVCAARSLFLCSCAVLQDHENPAVQAEATACLQQLHLFAPRHVNLSTLVPTLCNMLSSSHLLLRKAAVSCLRQLTQREAKEVCEYAMTLTNENGKESIEGLHIDELGLPGVLFSMLDTESDHTLVTHIHDTLTSMLQILAAESLTQWLLLCKDVLTVSFESSVKEEAKALEMNPDDFQLDADEDEDDNDAAEFKASDSKGTRAKIAPRWPTRVFAAQCVRKIIASCHSSAQAEIHFDLAKAKQCNLTRSRGGDFLVLHLAELVRMAFMAATSDSDPLRLEGLETLQDVIDKFAHVMEPEFPGHLLLEQYQAQVGAALRPAFTADTPPTVTAAACEVCSTWIGSGVARDLNDLRRVHQLLVSSLDKLRTGPANSKAAAPRLYNESLTTLECLAILRAWAEIYIVAIGSTKSDERIEDDVQREGLLQLVKPELPNLSQLWLSALRDHALLLLPQNYSSQLPHDGGAFYTCDTIEASRPHFVSAWPPLLHAITLWLTRSGGYQQLEKNGSDWNSKNANRQSGNICKDTFHLMFGICLEALCCPRSSQPISSISTCLKALITIMESPKSHTYLIAEDSSSLAVELCNVLHRLMLTRDSASIQLLVMDALMLVLEAGKISLERSQAKKVKELVPANQECDTQQLPEVLSLGEGGATGQLKANESVVFAALENPTSLLHLPSQGAQSKLLIASALQALSALPSLCSPQGILTVAPTLLYLATGVIEECAVEGRCEATSEPVVSTLQCLRSLASLKLAKQDSSEGAQMRKLLQSALGKLLDLAKTAGSEQTRLDATTVLLAIAVFILHSSPEVICTPTLLYPCVNHFKLCMESNNATVRLQCIQTLRAVFQIPEQKVAVAFIHNLAPRLIEILHLLTSNKNQLMNENQIAVAVEGLKTLESLVMLAKPQNRMQLLSLLLPILVNCLKEEQPGSRGGVSKQTQVLHEQSLGWLMRIAPQYPKDFKLLMNQLPQFRTRIQNAIKNSHSVAATTSAAAANKNATQQHQQQPTIKLKMDFSNFASQ
ncbi:Hypothetical predicted protein [Cloeon dipterum]|uniref:G domain-containing protein n=1 Tax=Cloeon dipterum TaxID=197152 RepID=A0A8S1E1B0_9INSE|nr:Hypothetical predicted protein [Cloeon dipterum]